MKLMKSTETAYRLLRTVIQGIIGVLVANIDFLIGSFQIPVEWKPMITALIMAVLSPVMSLLGGKDDD